MIAVHETDALAALTRGEADQLLLAIQASLAIRRRYQFHIWVQSRLAAVVPHDVMLCGQYDPVRRMPAFECFSMFPLGREVQAALVDPAAGLMREAIGAWHRHDRAPFSSGDPAPRASGLDRAMRELGVRDLVAHGTARPGEGGAPESFFCFLNVDDDRVPPQIRRDSVALGARHVFLTELLLPYLHVTFARVVAAERPGDVRAGDTEAPERLVTERELEILRWVREGKSNQQIGSALSISPLTVKNHIQKILRKLGASNRAQAVARAFDLGLMSDGAELP